MVIFTYVLTQNDQTFGMLVPTRHGSSEPNGYRYGFNGKENDNEVMGEGNWQEYGMRMYNPRIGRFPNVDPLTKKYPELTPYQYASNRPVQCIDLDGLEAYFNNSGEFVKWGVDKKETAPVILLQNDKELKTNLNVKQFRDRVHFLYGESSGNSEVLRYYAHTVKNAKAYGYHGKGFTESKVLDVLWQDNTYKKQDYLDGLPKEAKTNNYQPYKEFFKVKMDFGKWNDKMENVGKEILFAETGLSIDPTRGATNWGGGMPNYRYYKGKFGSENIVQLTTQIDNHKFYHNFFNLNTGELKDAPANSESEKNKANPNAKP